MKQREQVRRFKAWTELVRGFHIDLLPKNERMTWFKAALSFKEAILNHEIDGVKDITPTFHSRVAPPDAVPA